MWCVLFLNYYGEFSRSVWIYLLKKGSFRILKHFLAMVPTQFHKVAKNVKTDNGIEFICLKDYFVENGILNQTSIAGIPQQNGRVERKHHHILNVARALRFQANLPKQFWGESVLTVGYLINRTPSSILKGQSPYELLHGRPSQYSHIKNFGCLAFAHDHKLPNDKFCERGRHYVLLGCPFGKKGWHLYDIKTRNL